MINVSKFLIVGGAGFIGSYICRELKTNYPKDEVIVFDSFVNYMDHFTNDYHSLLKIRFKDLEGIKFVRGDLRYRMQIIDVLKNEKPDIIINLAAIPDARKSNKFCEDAIDINLLGHVNLLEAIKSVGGIKRIVFTSSSFVYGNFEYAPADEKHPVEPIDVYGGSKLSGEILTKAYGRRFGIEWTIIRPSAVYGPGDSYDRVSQIFVNNALKGETIFLDNGGAGRLDFSYVSDVAKGFVLAAKSPNGANQIFNITRGEGRQIREFAEIVAKEVPKTKIQTKPQTEIRPERGALNIEKAKKLLGYNPQISIEVGIKKYIQGIKENRQIV
ncbi:MAG: NAD-dependent epimerase/dehydratase family protein [Candidatus Diapherotrites archaeon]|nr:NAD-dependent epimerase/dehydratase family protein [Candidatus Diapherotrites archaeon]